jgi:hypothetical protein
MEFAPFLGVRKKIEIPRSRMKTNKTREIFFKMWRFFSGGKREASNNPQPFLELASGKQMKGNPQLKIAEKYQKQGERQRPLQDNLRSAKLFCDTGKKQKGAAICHKLLKQGSEMELVRERNSGAKKDDHDRIVETPLLHPPDTEICFFDLAKILEANNSLELGEIKSITIEESYRSEIFLEDSKENMRFGKTISP